MKSLPLPRFWEIPWFLIGLAVSRLKTLDAIAARYPWGVQLPLPGRAVMLWIAPEAADHVLQKNAGNYNRSFDSKFLADLMGDGLLTATIERWREYRKAVQPVFHRGMILSHGPTMQKKLSRHLDGWTARGAKDFDLADDLTDLAITVIGLTVFDFDLESKAADISSALVLAQRYIYGRAMDPFNIQGRLVKLGIRTPGRKRFEKAARLLKEQAETIMAAELKNGPGRAFFSTLRNELSAEAAVSQALAVLLAGHETIAVALFWTLFELSKHPEWNDRIRAEMNTHREQINREGLTSEVLAQLRSLRAVVEESLRLRSPVWSVGREAIADDVVGGVTVRAGSTHMISPYATQRCSKYWTQRKADPKVFHPDPEQLPSSNPAYFPFSRGPRRCVGEQFALQELMLALALIVDRFDIQFHWTAPDVPASAMITVRPNRKVRVTATARSYRPSHS